MGPAEDWKFVAVQEPVKPVTGRLRDHYGVPERREDPDTYQEDFPHFVNLLFWMSGPFN